MQPTLLHPLPSPLRPTRSERRRLAARDRVSARLAELDSVARLLRTAAVRVQAGWCQHTWTSPSSGVCLVSAVRVSGAAGAPQTVDRAVDVAWHTLYGDPAGVRWVPAPTVRLSRVRDLARWNDHRSRTSGDVTALLSDAAGYADREMVRLRSC